MSEWTWVYLGLAGLGETMAEIENGEVLFSNEELPCSLAVRNFTNVKVRKETRDEMQARAKAYKIEVPIQETMIEAFPWIVEQEKAVKDGVIFTSSIVWARRPCDELIDVANKLWNKTNIITARSL